MLILHSFKGGLGSGVCCGVRGGIVGSGSRCMNSR